MLFTKKAAHEKRADFRAALRQERILCFPGSHSPLCSMAIERHGYDGIYISGAVLSADLGLPDIGLTTLSEVAQRGHQIARTTELPAIIDVDTGFGEPMNVARTIMVMEEMGLAGCHLEDQENPKRCGHLDHKSVVPREIAVRRIRAAVDAKRDSNFLIIARTDSRTDEGLQKALDRAKAYADAGAEMIFPEALHNLGEFEAMARALDVPFLANMTEFGKSDLFTADQLETAGVRLVIYPVTTLRIAMGATERALKHIKETETQKALLGEMQDRQALYESCNTRPTMASTKRYLTSNCNV